MRTVGLKNKNKPPLTKPSDPKQGKEKKADDKK